MHSWMILTAGLRSCGICEHSNVRDLSSAHKLMMGLHGMGLSYVNISKFPLMKYFPLSPTLLTVNPKI